MSDLIKDELSTKLVEVITSIQSAASKAGDFAMEQLPDIAQSYIAYGRIASLVMLTFWLVVFITGIFMSLGAIKKAKEGYSEETILTPFLFPLASGVMILVGSVMFMGCLKASLLVWIAPKVWLIKEIAVLVK